MYVIGLTGGIASGKSTVAQTLRKYGAHVIDADAISRALTSPGGAAADKVVARFGTLDRHALAHTIYSDDKARADLNAIVHPLVKSQMAAEMASSGAAIVVLDVPLLYEAGMEGMADEVWTVHVPVHEQIQRLRRRNNLSETEALSRIRSQMPTQEKMRRADVTIDTSGTLEETQQLVGKEWQQAVGRARTKQAHTYVKPMPMSVAVNGRRSRARWAQQQESQRQLETAMPAYPAQPAQPAALEARPAIPIPSGPWEETSTLLEKPEERTFFSRQPPLFWIIAGLLLAVLLVVVGIITINAWQEGEARRAEELRLQLLAEEKAKYKYLYRDEIEEYSALHGIEPAVVAAVIYNESRFVADAESYLGARGLMQIMEDTGEWLAEKMNESDTYTFDLMYSAEANIRYGTWYLAYLARLFEGNLVKIAAGYHAGQNRVLSWLDNPEYSPDGKTLAVIPFEDTEQYVQRVVAAYEIYKKHYYTPETDTAENAA